MAMQVARVGHRLTRSGKYLHRVQWVVADYTGSAHLSVWEPLELSHRKWYRITNVSPQYSHQNLFLQTTPGSTAEEVQRSPSPSGNPHSSLGAVTVEILGLRLKAEFCCPECHLLEGLSSRQDVDCGCCDMKYSQADLKLVLRGSLRDRQSNRVLKLKDVHIRDLLKEALEGGRDTIDELETALKEVCFLQVTIYQNNVIAVSRTSPGPQQKPLMWRVAEEGCYRRKRFRRLETNPEWRNER
ncbi:unnamed protein product [Merluccius merluccius]